MLDTTTASQGLFLTPFSLLETYSAKIHKINLNLYSVHILSESETADPWQAPEFSPSFWWGLTLGKHPSSSPVFGGV
jgi:hypothetical protein